MTVVGYQHTEPAGLVHLDTKKLSRIVGGSRHRAIGDRRSRRRGVSYAMEVAN